MRAMLRTSPHRSRGPASAGRRGTALLLSLALLAAPACTTTPFASPPPPRALPRAAVPPELAYSSVPLEDFLVTPENITVEDNFLLDVYTFFHARNYRVSRVEFPGHAQPIAVAHWMVPDGPGPHPTVILFPILAGTQVVSELAAKALVRRGYAVAHMERKEMQLETARTPDIPSTAMRSAVRDARRLIDWLETRPEVDRDRIAAAGISMGGMLGAVLQGSDPRVRAGFYFLAGGGLAELLYDSAEKPVRHYRDRLAEAYGYETRDAFVSAIRPLTVPIDPLTVAPNIPADSVLIASGRLDRVMPRARTQELWEALGEPAWLHVPFGHYQSLLFLWWSVARGADHLDAYFAAHPTPDAPQPRAASAQP